VVVEATARDAKARGQLLDADSADAGFDELLDSRIDPVLARQARGFGCERLPMRNVYSRPSQSDVKGLLAHDTARLIDPWAAVVADQRLCSGYQVPRAPA
jgi:hypothetical protein